MGAGKFDYLWRDEKSKKNLQLSAPDYISKLSEWIAGLLNSEEFLPKHFNDSSNDDDFVKTVKTIFRRLFRVYAHLYYSHFKECKKLLIHRHLNTAFTHFMLFCKEFNLLEKNDISPLKKTITDLIPDYFD